MANNGSKKPTRDVDDISLDDARPANKSGSGGATLALILLVICAALVWFIISTQQKNAAKAAEDKRQREVTRQASVDQAKKNLQLASDAAAAGNLDEAIRKLEAADGLLGNLISAANGDGDTEAAAAMLSQKSPAAAALSALKAKKQELQSLADEQFGLLRTQFGLTAPAPAAETPAATTPEGTPPATGTEATPPAAPPGAETPPAAPPAAPAPAAAPAAPVAPAPAS